MFFDHKWSELTGSEKSKAKTEFGSKQSWQDAKAAAGYRAHHSANPGSSGSTGGSIPIPGGFSFDTGSPNVGPTVPTTSTPTVTTTTPTVTTTKPPVTTGGGDKPLPGGFTFDFDDKNDAPGKNGGDVPGTEFQYNGPSNPPQAGDPPPGGGAGPDIPDDYEPPKTGDGLGPTFGENSWKEQEKDDDPWYDEDKLNFGFGYDGEGYSGGYGVPDDGQNPGGGQNPNTYVYGGTPGNSQGGTGGNATIAEGAIQINLGDMMSGGGGESTEVGYLGGGGAGLSKFDPAAFMGGLQASLPTWKGGGKAQATGMFNSRMNLGRN